MNKQGYLEELSRKLRGLPKEDIEKSVGYYREMIEDRMEDGMSEEEAVAAMETPEEAATLVFGEIPLGKLVKTRLKPKHTLRVWEIVLIALGSPIWASLLLAVIAVVLAVYIVIWSVVVTLYAADFAFASGGIAGIGMFVFYIVQGKITEAVAFFGVGLLMFGLTILMFIGCGSAVKGMLWLSKKMFIGIKSCFVRRGRE